MFYPEKMIGNFHDTTTAVAAGNERQGKHVKGE